MATGYGRRVRLDFQKLLTNNSPATYTAWFAGLCTTNPLDDGSGNTAGGTEPSSTGSYARQAITWTAPTQPSLDASVLAVNSASISWTSTAAFSTGATVLNHVGIWNTATLATVTEAAYIGRAAITVPQAVNAAGITLTIAISGLSMGCISA
jgi:hypothetical protein